MEPKCSFTFLAFAYVLRDVYILFFHVFPVRWNCDPRPTFCTRLLYTVLPSPYSQENVRVALADMVNDLNRLSTEGVAVVDLVLGLSGLP